jgi:hypothetical protein
MTNESLSELALFASLYLLLKIHKERGLNINAKLIMSLTSLSFIRRGIEGEVSQEHK